MEGTNQTAQVAPQTSSATPTSRARAVSQPATSQQPTYQAHAPVAPQVPAYQAPAQAPQASAPAGIWQQAFQALSASLNTGIIQPRYHPSLPSDATAPGATQPAGLPWRPRQPRLTSPFQPRLTRIGSEPAGSASGSTRRRGSGRVSKRNQRRKS